MIVGSAQAPTARCGRSTPAAAISSSVTSCSSGDAPRPLEHRPGRGGVERDRGPTPCVEDQRLQSLQDVFFAYGNEARAWLTGFHADVRQAEIAARDATPQDSYWTAGKAPILDIQGEQDPLRPPDSSTELIEQLGDTRVTAVRISDAAHALPLEQPDQVAEAIIEWARDLPRGR